MPAMGKLEPDERYILTFEILGPKNEADAEKVNALVDQLKRTFGASVKVAVTGSKSRNQ